MNRTTKVLATGLAGCGLLLTACEVPGGGAPPRAIVFPDPTLERTPFSGFPATFKGTNLVEPPSQDEASTQRIVSPYDAFTTSVDGDTDLVISCEVYDDGTTVYVDWGDDDAFFDCSEGDGLVTVDAGEVYVEIHSYSDEPGLHPYVVHADLDEVEPT